MTEVIVKNNDYSFWDNNPKIYLERIDRNGTHHYIDTRCPKCSGTGWLPYMTHVDGGRCFKCGGSGDGFRKRVVVWTPEYAEKIKAKREKAEKEKAKEHNKKFLDKMGFTPDGKTYIVLGNTYEIKDQLKAEGGFFSRTLGWHFNHSVDNHPVKELSVDEPLKTTDEEEIYLFETNHAGAYYLNSGNEIYVSEIIKGYRNDYLNSLPSSTEWIGEVGKRITIENCKCSILCSWEGYYGVTILYKFVTPDGNVLTWKTAKNIDTDTPVTLTGTIKEHSKYKGEKQTELTRCRVQ